MGSRGEEPRARIAKKGKQSEERERRQEGHKATAKGDGKDKCSRQRQQAVTVKVIH